MKNTSVTTDCLVVLSSAFKAWFVLYRKTQIRGMGVILSIEIRTEDINVVVTLNGVSRF